MNRLLPAFSLSLLLAVSLAAPRPSLAQEGPSSGSRFSYQPQDQREALALALHHAREGRFEESLSLLDEEEDPRLLRETERIQVMKDYRQTLLESKVGKAIRLTVGAEITRITAFADGELTLKSKTREWTLPIIAIGPEQLISIQGRRDIENAPAWVGAYARLLAGQEDHDRHLGDDAASESLRSDSSDYVELRKTGHAAFLMASLGDVTEPAASLERIEALATYRDLPLVRRRLDDIRALASSIVAASFDPSSLEAFDLQGQVKATEDGGTWLVYDFDEASETADFVEMPGYLQSNRGRLLGPAAEAPSHSQVDGGALELRGASCYRHVLAFQAPMKVRYRIQYNPAPQDPNPFFMLGICADEKETHVGFENVSRLYSLNRETGVRRVRNFQEAKLLANRMYTIELSHEGEGKAKVTIDSDWREVEADLRAHGHVILWFHNVNGIRIERLEIQGTLFLDERARQEWVESQLTELGFEAREAGER